MTTNVKGTRGTIRNVLNSREFLALVEIIRARYVESRLDNNAFAKTLNDTPSERSSFRADITQVHIANCIEALGIPGNRMHHRVTESDIAMSLIVRVQMLEDQMAKVMARLLVK